MFLSKKAEETMAALIKQAKDILEGKGTKDSDTENVQVSPDIDEKSNKFKEIVNLINENEFDKAVSKLNPTEFPIFTMSTEFKSLPEDKRMQFNASYTTNVAVENKVQKEVQKQTESGKKEPVATEPAKKTDEPTNLDDLFNNEATPDTKKETESTEESGAADLNDVPLGPNASIFDYLSKKAEDTYQPLEVTSYDADLDNMVRTSVSKFMEDGCSGTDAKKQALREVGKEGDVHLEQIADDEIKKFSENKTKTIENATQNTENLLNAVSSYKPEASVDEQIVELSKSSSTAYEFLNKVADLSKQANKLDEITGKQYPGQKQFDGKTVSHDGGFGVSPQHPGQKISSTREGGNAAVESNFPKLGKPETDTFDRKSDKSNVVSINSLDGTIAFMQPLPFEVSKMGEPADYTGFVTGTFSEKKGNPEAAGPLAEAGHKTNQYLDKVYEVADKKEPAKKSAGFTFHGISKKASDTQTDIANIGGGGVSSDAAFDASSTNGRQKKKLTVEESIEARKKLQEQEDSITRANSLDEHLKTIASTFDEVDAMVSFSDEKGDAIKLIDELKQTPEMEASYNAILKAADQDDLNSFKEVLKNALISNLTQSHPEVNELVTKIPFDQVKNELKKRLPKKQEQKPDTKENSGKNSDKKEENKQADSPNDAEAPEGGDDISSLLGL